MSKNRQPRAMVEAAIIAPISKYLNERGVEFTVCGSYRRGREQIGDVDILINALRLPDIIADMQLEVFENQMFLAEWVGEEKAAFLVNGFQVDFKNVNTLSWGSGLLHHTGPVDFNIWMRGLAKSRGMLLNEYGLYVRATMHRLAGESEEGVFRKLGLDYISPENRGKKQEGKKQEWRVPSSSGNGTYLVVRDQNGMWCSCLGFKYRRDCKHVEEKKNA